MGRRCIRIPMVLLLGLLLVSSTVMAACGGEDRTAGKIRIGILTDFTGPAALATTVTVDAFKHAIRFSLEQDPIPGLDIEYVSYDQRTDPARVSPGYMYLKGRGVDLMFIISPTDCTILADDIMKDQMPVIGSNIAEEVGNHPNIFNMIGSDAHTIETVLQWVMDNWDYDGKGRLPRIAHLSWTHPTGGFHQAGFNRMLEWYPDKFEWLGVEAVPLGTTGFAAEVSRLRTADFIYVTPVGAMQATFIREARDRGYTNALVTWQFCGYWPLVRGAVAANQLYECYFPSWMPYWHEHEDVPVVGEAVEAIKSYSRNPDAIFTQSAPTGWLQGMVTINAIRNAVQNVGLEDLDRSSLLEGFIATDMDIEGFGNAWKILEDDDWKVFCRTMKMYKWDVEKSGWVDTETGWVTSPSLTR